MINKIKLTLLSLMSIFGFAAPLAMAASVSAQNAVTQPQVNNGLCKGANGDFTTGNTVACTDGSAEKAANKLVTNIINILSVVVGVIAVIMIIFAGFRYVTSSGKDESVKGAKNTILYAIIGLVIVALAQIIVHFVLAKTTNATS
jgi:heme/copper-type cytochrome/quinol oxidase subunit 2